MERRTNNLSHADYSERRRVIEEQVWAELAEEVEYFEITLTEAEQMYADWLNRFHDTTEPQ